MYTTIDIRRFGYPTASPLFYSETFFIPTFCIAAHSQVTMLRSRQATKAFQALGQQHRCFTSTTAPVTSRAAKKLPLSQRNNATAATSNATG